MPLTDKEQGTGNLPITENDIVSLGFSLAGMGGSFKKETQVDDYHVYIQLWSSGKVYNYKILIDMSVTLDRGSVYTYDELRKLLEDLT